MPNLDLYVWWSEGRGDGDGYDTDYEVTDEQYKLFRNSLRDGTNPDDSKEIAAIWKKITDEKIDELMEVSLEFEEEEYMDECLIDPDSDEYDPDGEEEQQFTQSMSDWWKERVVTGVKLYGFETDEHTFNITISNGNEVEFKFNLYRDEIEKLQELKNNNESLDTLENDEDYGYLYSELTAAAKQKFQDDDLEYSISCNTI